MVHSRLYTSAMALLWCLAFVLTLPVFPSLILARLAAVACVLTGAALAAGVVMTRRTGFNIPRSAFFLLLTLFVLNAVRSTIMSDVPTVSISALGALLFIPAGIVMAFCVPDRTLFIRICAVGGGLVLGVLAAWVPIQYVFFPQMLLTGQVRAPFQDPNIYAVLMLAGFFPVLGLILMRPSRWIANAGLVLAILCLTALILLSGRAAFLSALGGLALFLFLNRRHLRGHARCGGLLLMSALAAFILPSLLGEGRITIFDRLPVAAADAQNVVDSRILIWRGTIDIIKKTPLVGTGLGTFFLHYPAHRFADENFSGGFSAHNDPLQFWAEMGVAAPVLFYLMLLAAGWRMIGFLRAAPPADIRRLSPSALFAALAAIVVHAHVNADFYAAPVLCVTGLLLAVWHDRTALGPSCERKICTPWIGGIAAIVPAAVFLFLLQGILVSEHHVERARQWQVFGHIEKFADSVNAADRAGWGLNARPYILAASVPIGLLQTKVAPAADTEKLTAQAASLLNKAQARNPYLPSLYYARAELAAATGGDPVSALREGLLIHPQHLASRLMLADILSESGQDGESYGVLVEGLPWFYPAQDHERYYRILERKAQARNDQEVLEIIAARRHVMAHRWPGRGEDYSGGHD